jgi:glycerol-3-phosphate dehydrogenase subunit C
MLKQEYKELFPNVTNAGRNAANVVDACEFIAELIETGEWKPEFTTAAQTERGIYHAPCHLRAQGIGKTGFHLLKMIPQFEVTDADAGCCGISGSYGFKKDKYNIAMAVGNKLFTTIDESDAQYALTECGTCQVQIKHGIDKSKGHKVLHPISMLRQRVKI